MDSTCGYDGNYVTKYVLHELLALADAEWIGIVQRINCNIFRHVQKKLPLSINNCFFSFYFIGKYYANNSS